jgi:hypothetical protein
MDCAPAPPLSAPLSAPSSSATVSSDKGGDKGADKGWGSGVDFRGNLEPVPSPHPSPEPDFAAEIHQAGERVPGLSAVAPRRTPRSPRATRVRHSRPPAELSAWGASSHAPESPRGPSRRPGRSRRQARIGRRKPPPSWLSLPRSRAPRGAGWVEGRTAAPVRRELKSAQGSHARGIRV